MKTTKHSTNEIFAFEIEEIIEELVNSRRKHGNFKSAHEGYAIMLEEMDELWDEIKEQKPNPEKMGDEARQIAAMALKFLLNIVHGRKPK